MSYSNLILHKNKNSLYQYFEINMPYLILYENVNPAANSSMYMELSESSIVDAHMDYKAFLLWVDCGSTLTIFTNLPLYYREN